MARFGIILVLLVVIGALSLISINLVSLPGDDKYNVKEAGFFSGLVHGLLAPVTLVIGLFTSIQMYELNNIGWWYNFGFLIGLLAVWTGGATRNITKNYYYGDSKTNQINSKNMKEIENIVDRKIEKKLKEAKQPKKKERDWKFWKWRK